MMRHRPLLLLSALATLVLAACSPSPTGEDIDRLLDAELSSVAGDWTGTGAGGGFTINFRLAQGAGGQVTGTGALQERGAASPSPVTISGSYQRPDLVLAFDGAVYEGRAVRATFRAAYTSVAGISDTLVFTGEGYSKRVGVLMQETPR